MVGISKWHCKTPAPTLINVSKVFLFFFVFVFVFCQFQTWKYCKLSCIYSDSDGLSASSLTRYSDDGLSESIWFVLWLFLELCYHRKSKSVTKNIGWPTLRYRVLTTRCSLLICRLFSHFSVCSGWPIRKQWENVSNSHQLALKDGLIS